MEDDTRPVVVHHKRAKSSQKKWMWISIIGAVIMTIITGAVVWNITRGASDESTSNAALMLNADGFSPASAKIHEGDDITITNSDTMAHNLAADEESMPGFTTAETLDPEATYTYTFDEKGTYVIYDPSDPSNIQATIIVE